MNLGPGRDGYQKNNNSKAEQAPTGKECGFKHGCIRKLMLSKRSLAGYSPWGHKNQTRLSNYTPPLLQFFGHAMWYVDPGVGIELLPSTLDVWSLNHWTSGMQFQPSLSIFRELVPRPPLHPYQKPGIFKALLEDGVVYILPLDYWWVLQEKKPGLVHLLPVDGPALRQLSSLLPPSAAHL